MRIPLLPRNQAAARPVPGQRSSSAPEPTANEGARLTRTQDVQAAPAVPAPGMTRKGKVRRTRASAWWVGLIIAAVILVALLIFIAQNLDSVAVHYLGVQGHVSLAIALVLSAIAGMLLVAIPGTARMAQLRRALKKNANGPSDLPR